MEGLDVVDLQIHFHEGLPVAAVVGDLDAVERVAGKIEVRGAGDSGEVGARVARAGEEQTAPVDERRGLEPHAGTRGEVRRAEQLAAQVVSPAVRRADDVAQVAAALQHQRLAVAADVGEQRHAAVVSHQDPGVVHPLERVIVARLGHHALVADVLGAGFEEQPFLPLEHRGVEIPGHRQLAAGGPDAGEAGEV